MMMCDFPKMMYNLTECLLSKLRSFWKNLGEELMKCASASSDLCLSLFICCGRQKPSRKWTWVINTWVTKQNICYKTHWRLSVRNYNNTSYRTIIKQKNDENDWEFENESYHEKLKILHYFDLCTFAISDGDESRQRIWKNCRSSVLTRCEKELLTDQ